MMKFLCVALMLALIGCNPEKQWQLHEITGHLPDLRFSLMSDTGQPVTDQSYQGYLYRLMNWSMVLTGLTFWGLVLDSDSIWSSGSRIAMMLAVVPPQILIGALIFFSPHELYPIYSLCGRVFTGMSAATDQQLGGLILWMHAAMMSMAGILIVIHKEFRLPNKRLL